MARGACVWLSKRLFVLLFSSVAPLWLAGVDPRKARGVGPCQEADFDSSRSLRAHTTRRTTAEKGSRCPPPPPSGPKNCCFQSSLAFAAPSTNVPPFVDVQTKHGDEPPPRVCDVLTCERMRASPFSTLLILSFSSFGPLRPRGPTSLSAPATGVSGTAGRRRRTTCFTL